MSRPNVSEVTEDEVQALFDEDGDLRERENTTDEDGTEPEETQDQTEADDSTDDESEETESNEIDWEKVDPRVREAYESVQKSETKWKTDYGKIQSKWTKDSQSRKQEESTLNELRARASQLEQWESLLGQNPKLAQLVEAELKNQGSPSYEVPDYLKNDPAFQFVQSQVTPLIQGLQKEIQSLRQKTTRIDDWDRREVETRNRQHLDGLLGQAKTQVKNMFGREATDEDVQSVLEYMVENKFYSANAGKASAIAVFQEQYEQQMRQRYDQELKEKAKKFPSRSKTVNSHRVAQTKDAASPEEAIAMALAEQGIN